MEVGWRRHLGTRVGNFVSLSREIIEQHNFPQVSVRKVSMELQSGELSGIVINWPGVR